MKTRILALVCLTTFTSLSAQVVLNELIVPNTVELKNTGSTPVDISGYVLCHFPNYNILTILTQVCGDDLILDPGDIIAVNTIFTFDAADGELGLYLNGDDFGDPDNITDYVEWGSTGHERSDVAQAAGIWSPGDFVPSWTGCASLEYIGSGDTSDDWTPQNVPTSPCLENSLDGCAGPECMFSGAGLSSIQCSNNGTPADPMDDVISFMLNPTGMDLGTAYTISVSAGTVFPDGGNYGGTTSFTLQPGSAGGGDIVITITDNIDTTCTISVVLIDPGNCSGDCHMQSTGLTGVGCNDNGTDLDPFDDYITFTLNPTGVNLGSGYSVTVTNGSVNPPSAGYGIPTVFTLNNGSAGGGNVTVIVRDADDPDCSLSAVINDPGECSLTPCDILSPGLDNIACNDNNTPIDPSDDYITFTLNPAGLHLGSSYSVTSSSGMITPAGGPYGQVTMFTLGPGTAGSGNVFITLIDDNDANCNVLVLVADPGPCSDLCLIGSAGLTSTSCSDNDTPDDTTDDVITFRLNPLGANLGETYSVSVSTGFVFPQSAMYGVSTLFTMQPGSAGGGNVLVTVSDDDDPTCAIEVLVVDPGPCSISGNCLIISLNLSDLMCNNNGTQEDASDDFITFTIDPEGEDLLTGYSISVSSGTITPSGADYGSPVTFALNIGSAGGGNVFITVTDNIDPSCTLSSLVLDPGPCSVVGCALSDAGLSDIFCNDNDSADPSDDFIAFSLDPAGVELSTTYVVTVSTGTVTPSTASYGTATTFILQDGSAGAGDVTLTIRDSENPLCSLSVVIPDPGACSTGCFLFSAGLDSIACDGNGTPVSIDDFITFILDPAGVDLSTTYTVQVSSGTITPSTGAYGAPASFSLDPGSAGAGDVTVTITDGGNEACQLIVAVTDPGACTGCDIADAGLDEILCDDNGTASVFSDDFITFILDPSGSDLSDAYTVSSSSGMLITPTGAAYGTSTLYSLPPGSAGNGNVEIVITDAADTTCTLTVIVADPGICSLAPCTVSACDISTLSETTICVDDGGIPDTVYVSCAGGTPGAQLAWLVTSTTGDIMRIETFGGPGEFVFEGEDAGTCLIWTVAWEGNLNGLNTGSNITGLTGCYDLSNPLEITKVTGTQCASATFSPLPDDLISVYPIPTSGLLYVESQQIQIVQLHIIDPVGRTVFSSKYDASAGVIDIRLLDAGMYYCIVETSAGKYVRRIVVSR